MNARSLESQLFPAIENDDANALRSLIGRGADPAYQESGVSLLAYAKAQKSPHCGALRNANKSRTKEFTHGI